MKKPRAVILKNEAKDSHLLWKAACDGHPELLDFTIIDLTSDKWLEDILAFKPDLLLTKPGGLTSHFKQLYDERLMILVNELDFFCFPSLNEVLLYENKRYLSYWLKANRLPHPETHVYYSRSEAVSFINSCSYPIVAKVNIGASGSGVSILNNKKEAHKYIQDTFSGRGAKKRSGPNLGKGGILKRGSYYLLHPRKILSKFEVYLQRFQDIQKDFVLIQEYIPHTFEWRVVRMGDSFFAHQKLKSGEKASGTQKKGYVNPPESLLNFVKGVTDQFDLMSQAVDVFEYEESYLINEMQCIFGQSDKYQMLVNDTPGRYIHENERWIFETGEFNDHESYDLRLLTALKLFKKQGG